MRQTSRLRFSYANVVSTVCLFVVLGGGAWAATQLEPNSVGTVQLRSDAVVTQKVRDGTLLPADFRPGLLQPRGYAAVSVAGGFDPVRSKGVNGVVRVDDLSSPRTTYCFDLAFVPKHALANPFLTNSAVIGTAVSGNNLVETRCPENFQDAAAAPYASSDSTPVAINFSIVFF
jgi:hypothetical protein